ncbi:MAG: hypothetical protein WCJ64_07680 [Rhodospirillaceae bacterium]
MKDYTQLDQPHWAKFSPAVSSAYSRSSTVKGRKPRVPAEPQIVPARDLDFLSPDTTLVRLNIVLASAGQFAKTAPAAKASDMLTIARPGVVRIADSGGFQLGANTMPYEGPPTMERILLWQERFDLAMTMDFPLASVAKGAISTHIAALEGPLKDIVRPVLNGVHVTAADLQLMNGQSEAFNVCLTFTLFNNQWYVENRTPGATDILNVIQGTGLVESRVWCDAVKDFPFEGFALAGQGHLHNAEMSLTRIIQLRDEGKLDTRRWLHFLGTSEPANLCFYSTVQQCLTNDLGSFTVSADASSAFTRAVYGQVSVGFTLGRGRWVTKITDINALDLVGSDEAFLDYCERRWRQDCFNADFIEGRGLDATGRLIDGDPRFFVQTEIGKRLRVGDVCVKRALNDKGKPKTWGTHTLAYMMNHNLQINQEYLITALTAYDEENRTLVPSQLIELKQVVPEIFRSERPMDTIYKHRRLLNLLALLSDMRSGYR